MPQKVAGAQGSALTVAVSNAGGLGALPCAMLGPDALRQELASKGTLQAVAAGYGKDNDAGKAGLLSAA